MNARAMVLLAGCLAGCQTVPTGHELQDRHTRTVAWAYTKAWERALATGTREGYVLMASDRRRGALVFERDDPGARVREYASGTGQYMGALWWRLHIVLRVRVQALSPTQTRVQARADLSAEMSLFDPRHGSSGFTTLPLTSDGTLERLYLDEAVLTLPP